jgi:APA family basic amino acid/polyamine antiporter
MDAAPTHAAPGPLRRAIGRNMLLVFVLGDVLGAGIYALVGEVAADTGGAIWAAFAVALLLAVFTATSYAELVTKCPRAAGAALYVKRAPASCRRSWPARRWPSTR